MSSTLMHTTRQRYTPTQQRGVAIVLAMSVVALAALAATAMIVSQSTWLRQAELTVDHAQAQHVIQAGLEWSRAVLSDDRRASQIDYPGEAWAMQLPPIPVDNGSLTGQIEDQQGKFNLNNLLQDGKINIAQLNNFQRLLSVLSLSPDLAAALADWLDDNNEPQPQSGAEDAYYLQLTPAYLTANRALTDIAGLAAVRGYDDNVRLRLRPFVSALPRYTMVNVNTAPAEVMAAVVDGLNLDDARAIVAQRERSYFRNTGDFTHLLPRGLVAPDAIISTNSDYFIASMHVTIGAAQAQGYALLERKDTGWPTIIWRKYL